MTGVQTCALPISRAHSSGESDPTAVGNTDLNRRRDTPAYIAFFALREIDSGIEPAADVAPNADGENGPAARSFAADAHDRIMVRINLSYRIQVCSTKMCPNGELLSDSQQTDRHQPDTEVREKPVSPFIIAPRAQASRRCETQAR